MLAENASGVVPTTVNVVARKGGNFETDLIVPLYAVIFVLSVVGNSLVLITLLQNRRMRTVTNVFLLNLAVSDLLLGVFCMPFTLIGQVLRNFVFGRTMCKIIPYFQAVSVSVTVWTLVAISMERYFAICRPLQSRHWQTRFHAYKVIGYVWMAALALNSPILITSRLQATRDKGRHKCREEWPSVLLERSFNICLDLGLLVIPLTVMAAAYALIVTKLWKGLKREIQHSNQRNNPGERSERAHAGASKPYLKVRHATICSAYAERSMEAKRKVIRMLFVLVVEFFVCWTPLHVLNTWYLFWPGAVYQAVGSTGVALVQLLAYCSSCCNPITYCFMNKKFRQAFVGLFGCCRGTTTTLAATRGSSANESVLFEVRPTMTKSLAVLEAEDCV